MTSRRTSLAKPVVFDLRSSYELCVDVDDVEDCVWVPSATRRSFDTLEGGNLTANDCRRALGVLGHVDDVEGRNTSIFYAHSGVLVFDLEVMQLGSTLRMCAQ